jgi:hypothetical protein
MTEEDRKKYEEAAKEYVKQQGTHDKPDITHHDFMAGCEYTGENCSCKLQIHSTPK